MSRPKLKCEIEITPEMIDAGVAALEEEMLEGMFLDCALREGVRLAFLAMCRVAKKATACPPY